MYEPYICGIGIDFKIKTLEIDGLKAKIQFWDTAGQERFWTITWAYYWNTHAILLCVDLSKDDDDTFKNLDEWHDQIKQHKDEKSMIFLIGTKSDIKVDSAVTWAEKYAEENNLYFF